MREIPYHIVNACNDKLRIEVTDEPGSGGASHRYEITGFDTNTNASATDPKGYNSSFGRLLVLFQNGPILEKGTNGVTHEALLAIVRDRLECFQAGPYACQDNSDALLAVKDAMRLLQKRTLARMARGVEGTHKL